MKATKLSISFYPAHIEVIDHYAQTLGLRGNNIRSPTLQKIVSEWAEARGYSLVTSASGRPIYNHAHSQPLPIGYLHLSDLIVTLKKTQPVYIAPHIETTHGTALGQHTDHQYLIATQPDALNRVHYCRIPLMKLVYHNGIPFAPDYREQLAQVEQVLIKVETRLVGEGCTVKRGMVAFPEGLVLLDGSF